MTALTISGFDGVLSAAQEGSEWAWDILVRDTAPRLVGFFRSRGVPDPEGLAGTAFIDLAQNLRSFTGDESEFRSWVFVIAYRRMFDERRNPRRRPFQTPSNAVPDAVDPSQSAEDIAKESVGSTETLQMLEVLTDGDRDVITLRIVAELTLDETAKAVGKPVGVVKALQRSGLTALRSNRSKGVAAMSDLRDCPDDMKRHDATDRDIERLIDGSLDSVSDPAPLADLVSTLRSEANAAVNDKTIAAYRRSSAIAAANTAQQFAVVRAEPAPPTQRPAPESLFTSFQRRVATIALAVATFVGSLSGVAVAADHAKPGDTLYGVDRALESFGIRNGHAEERLAEVQALFGAGEVPRGLRHAADLLNAVGPDNAAASAALLDAAERVMSGGSEQSAEARAAVAGLLSHLSKGAHEFNGLEVAEIARQIARPDKPSTAKLPVDPGPPDHSQGKAPGRPDFTPGSQKPPTGKP